MLTKLNTILTQKRLVYPFFFAAAIWGAWLITTFCTQGNMDAFKHPKGGDYIKFYVSGRMMLENTPLELYNGHLQKRRQEKVLKSAYPQKESYYYLYHHHPLLAEIFIPLALLPYKLSLFMWSLMQLLCLAMSVCFLQTEKIKSTLLWTLTWIGVITSIMMGQNGLVSLFVFSLVFHLWTKNKNFNAGLISALLIYKPHLQIALILMWLCNARKNWTALTGFLIGTISLWAFSFMSMPDATKVYYALLSGPLLTISQQPGFPLWHMYTVSAFWLLLLPASMRFLVFLLTMAFQLTGLVAGFILWRRYQASKWMQFAIVPIATLWVSPHIMVYDTAILIIPAVLFWKHLPDFRPILRPAYAIIWAAFTFSLPLILAQKHLLSVALHPGELAFMTLSYYLFRFLMRNSSKIL